MRTLLLIALFSAIILVSVSEARRGGRRGGGKSGKPRLPMMRRTPLACRWTDADETEKSHPCLAEHECSDLEEAKTVDDASILSVCRAKKCKEDSECGEGQTCRLGFCRKAKPAKPEAVKCSEDADCPEDHSCKKWLGKKGGDKPSRPRSGKRPALRRRVRGRGKRQADDEKAGKCMPSKALWKKVACASSDEAFQVPAADGCPPGHSCTPIVGLCQKPILIDGVSYSVCKRQRMTWKAPWCEKESEESKESEEDDDDSSEEDTDEGDNLDQDDDKEEFDP